MFWKRFLFCLALLAAVPGCPTPPPPPDPPKIICTSLDNDVYQFQYDNGSPLDMGVFLLYLDGWLKEHPEITVRSVVPQMNQVSHVENSRNSSYTVTRTVTSGVLVFAKVDRDAQKKRAEEEKKGQK